MFEIFEIVLLTILIIMLCIEEKYVVMSVFMMCLIYNKSFTDKVCI